MRKIMALSLLAVACAPLLGLAPATPRAPRQSTDPANPGSNVYHYAYQRHIVPTINGGGLEYYVPVPADSQATPGPYPVFVFLHGYMAYGGSLIQATGPLDYFYTAMFVDIARKGYVVIFPQYQANSFDTDYAAMAQRTFADITYVAAHTAKADVTRMVWGGHSMGGSVSITALGLAGSQKQYAQFTPKAFIGLAPYYDFLSISQYTASVSPDVAYVFMPGADDTIAPPSISQTMYGNLTQTKQKEIILIPTFANEQPQLIANHAAPMTRGSFPDGLGTETGAVNALDWWGYWKVTVGTLDQNFNGGSCTWVWGSERLDGGTDSANHKLLYTLTAEKNSIPCTQ